MIATLLCREIPCVQVPSAAAPGSNSAHPSQASRQRQRDPRPSELVRRHRARTMRSPRCASATHAHTRASHTCSAVWLAHRRSGRRPAARRCARPTRGSRGLVRRLAQDFCALAPPTLRWLASVSWAEARERCERRGRLRGGCKRAGAGRAMTHGHAAASRSGRATSAAASWSLALAQSTVGSYGENYVHYGLPYMESGMSDCLLVSGQALVTPTAVSSAKNRASKRDTEHRIIPFHASGEWQWVLSTRLRKESGEDCSKL